MTRATVKDVPADQLIHAYATLLKRQGKVCFSNFEATSDLLVINPFPFPSFFFLRCFYQFTLTRPSNNVLFICPSPSSSLSLFSPPPLFFGTAVDQGPRVG